MMSKIIPEGIMIGLLAYMFTQGNKDSRIGFIIFAGILIWGNFFNDIMGYLLAGFTWLFNN